MKLSPVPPSVLLEALLNPIPDRFSLNGIDGVTGDNYIFPSLIITNYGHQWRI